MTETGDTMEQEKLQPLFKRNSKGKIMFWHIDVEPNGDHTFSLVTRHGQVDGKVQETKDVISNGKNIGKANETTVFQQAWLEATSKWTKQIERKGYKPDINKLDIDERPGIEPMLAHRYDKYPDKITFPCFIQPKLDGHRCIAVIKDGKCNLYSRKRTMITALPHINEALECLGFTNAVLDGELYNHDYKNDFETLSSFIRMQEPKEGHEMVQYHVYDLVSDLDFEHRLDILHQVFDLPFVDNDVLKLVPTLTCTEDLVNKQFNFFVSEGYEGAILRNSKGSYEHKRSYNLQKVKQFEDSEFKIVDVIEGRGAMKGHAIFVCETPEGKTFKAKPSGSMDSLKQIFKDRNEFIGCDVTVQFQGYTNKKIPRFPVALRVRME